MRRSATTTPPATAECLLPTPPFPNQPRCPRRTTRSLGRRLIALAVVLVLGEVFCLLAVNRFDLSPTQSPHHNATTSPPPPRADADEVQPAGANTVHILDLLARRAPFKFDEASNALDTSGKYKIAHSFLTPEADLSSQDAGEVCLATQGSLDRLHHLVELAQLWNGPLSLAVFVANGAQFQALRAYLALVRSCSEPVRANMRVDLVYPAGVNLTRLVSWSRADVAGGAFSCAGHASLLRTLHSSGRARVRRFFLVDIDVMPKPGLWDELSDFFGSSNKRPCVKCVFVVPTYEAREMVPVPRTKRELLGLVRRKEARPFHFKSFIFNQYATNHAAWEALKHSEDGLRAAYKVQHYEFFYEPFYVAGKEVPRYDERFVGYGFTRNTQVSPDYTTCVIQLLVTKQQMCLLFKRFSTAHVSVFIVCI
ncbi:hypothetical protein HPB48_014819 [Haemaphysalis longicornis]|uniref:Beta-1,4-glucuronyltransferase 1 n=1 Tax=Haemaphysalis longicornis TaxID=44386 RepID=A0A9J6GGD9_HAELO|nr:hypothetical protein HPB48_014819 [Haemaphysalis longicornis]